MDASAKGPKGRRRERRRRQQVVDVAFDLFLERGYEKTTVEEIAAATDISPRTFYRYFDTKDGLLAELGFGLVDEVVERLEPSTEPPPLVLLARSIAAVLTSSLDDRRVALYVRLLSENADLREKAGRWREQWAAQVAQGLADADGRDHPTFAEQVVCRTAMTVVAAAFDYWIPNDPEHTSLAAAVETALSVIHDSMA